MSVFVNSAFRDEAQLFILPFALSSAMASAMLVACAFNCSSAAEQRLSSTSCASESLANSACRLSFDCLSASTLAAVALALDLVSSRSLARASLRASDSCKCSPTASLMCTAIRLRSNRAGQPSAWKGQFAGNFWHSFARWCATACLSSWRPQPLGHEMRRLGHWLRSCAAFSDAGTGCWHSPHGIFLLSHSALCASIWRRRMTSLQWPFGHGICTHGHSFRCASRSASLPVHVHGSCAPPKLRFRRLPVAAAVPELACTQRTPSVPTILATSCALGFTPGSCTRQVGQFGLLFIEKELKQLMQNA
mmetsp:Transcript_2356/g.4947  ORF Transcript_2356/g.4947 Transcript_2356/m.4947 type:complete len:306 (+) Transcript_2356:116-1033(+)